MNANAIGQQVDWLQTLTRMPDVMAKTEVETLTDEEWEVARQAVEQAIKNLVDFRIQEGAALQKKFAEKIDNIEALLQSIEPYEKSRVEKIRTRIVDGLKQIPSAEYDKNRLEQELIYYIEKLDISEEKQRLANHLKYFRETMADHAVKYGTKKFVMVSTDKAVNPTNVMGCSNRICSPTFCLKKLPKCDPILF